MEAVIEEKFYVSSQWQLMGRKFVKHKLAIFGGVILVVLYAIAIFSGFFATQDMHKRNSKYVYCPPQRVHFFDGESFHFRPFVYGLKYTRDLETLQKKYSEDRTKKYPIYFFLHSNEYKFWGLFKTDIHFLGVKEGTLFLLGTDNLGRDLLSRAIYGARISLSIGLIGVTFSFVIGSIMGGISGYYGGTVDTCIQRVIEFLLSIPTIPLWMALSAALPPLWSPIKVYIAITIILAIQGWCYLARTVRGKLISLREENFIIAAKIAGASDSRIIARHLLPSFFSYLVVSLTLAIPNMILGETALSFLGLGLRPPVVSWGVLLQQAQNFRTLAIHFWLLAPGFFVIITVLAFNFLGDGLRDAADPYK